MKAYVLVAGLMLAVGVLGISPYRHTLRYHSKAIAYRVRNLFDGTEMHPALNYALSGSNPSNNRKTVRLKVTAYYPVWMTGPYGSPIGGGWTFACPPDSIDWTDIDYVVHFSDGNVMTASPWCTLLTSSSNDSIEQNFGRFGGNHYYADSLTAQVHRKGGQVLLCVQAVNPKQLDSIASDSTKVHNMAKAFVGYVRRHNYDGLDFDYEGWQCSVPDLNRIVRLLRVELNTLNPPGSLLVSASMYDYDNYWPSQDNLVTLFNPQFYAYSYSWNGLEGFNGVWHVAAVDPGYVPLGFDGKCLATHGPKMWSERGHRVDKIGAGMWSGAVSYKGADTLFVKWSDSKVNEVSYNYVRHYYLRYGGTMNYDSVRGIRYVNGKTTQDIPFNWWGAPGMASGTAFWCSYVGPETHQQWVGYLKSAGYAGIMLYDMSYDFDPDSTNGHGRLSGLEVVKTANKNWSNSTGR